MIYLISYDLNGKDDDYPTLWGALRSDGAIRILFSEWLMSSNESALQVANRYARHLDANDRLFVSEVTQNCAYLNLQNQPQAQQFLLYARRAA